MINFTYSFKWEASFTVVLTADTTKPSTHTTAVTFCLPCLCYQSHFNLWINGKTFKRPFVFPSCTCLQSEWSRTRKYLLTRENKHYNRSHEMYTQHETSKTLEDAASQLYGMHSLAPHVFRIFCVSGFRKLHVCWTFFYVNADLSMSELHMSKAISTHNCKRLHYFFAVTLYCFLLFK